MSRADDGTLTLTPSIEQPKLKMGQVWRSGIRLFLIAGNYHGVCLSDGLETLNKFDEYDTFKDGTDKYIGMVKDVISINK